MVSQGFNKDSLDGLLIGPFALEIDSQILFNLHCNNRMNFNDASCCSQPESVSLIQQIIFSFFFIWLVFLSFKYFFYLFSFMREKFAIGLSWNFGVGLFLNLIFILKLVSPLWVYYLCTEIFSKNLQNFDSISVVSDFFLEWLNLYIFWLTNIFISNFQKVQKFRWLPAARLLRRLWACSLF